MSSRSTTRGKGNVFWIHCSFRPKKKFVPPRQTFSLFTQDSVYMQRICTSKAVAILTVATDLDASEIIVEYLQCDLCHAIFACPRRVYITR